MGTTQYIIKVTFPDGSTAVGVNITGINRDAWTESARYWYGTTNLDGSYTWDHIDTGINGDKYDFTCRYVDSKGSEWKGEASDRIFTRPATQIKTIVLRQPFLDEDLDFTLPGEIESVIAGNQNGNEILAAIKEMGLAIKQGMSHSAIALSTYIIEGLIIMKSKENKIWKTEWNKYTYGQLIKEEEIKAIIPADILERAIALNHLRILGVHFKGTSSIIEDAKSGVQVILFLAKTWFMPSAPNRATVE